VKNKLEAICHDLLEAIGEDPEREGLIDTPRRFAGFWTEFMQYKPGKTDTVFESLTVDQMVVLRDIRVWSLCEHHLLPFYCDITIGYIASEHVIGISKLARIAKKHARKLQLQERLCNQIAEEVVSIVKSEDVAVIAKGTHLCMAMRGIESAAEMISSDVRGKFLDLPTSRAEFFKLAGF